MFSQEDGSLAQLGERLGHNQKVMGSSPVVSIKKRIETQICFNPLL